MVSYCPQLSNSTPLRLANPLRGTPRPEAGSSNWYIRTLQPHPWTLLPPLILIFLVRWPTAALMSNWPIPGLSIVTSGAPKWSCCKALSRVIVFPEMADMVFFSRYSGSLPEGPSTITSPTFHPAADATVIWVAPASAKAASLVQVVVGTGPYSSKTRVTARTLELTSILSSITRWSSPNSPSRMILTLPGKGSSADPAMSLPVFTQILWALKVLSALLLSKIS